MKTRIITVCFLFLQLLFAGCSKEEAIDNVDPDVPEVEISEEEMEIAIQNLERVEEAMSPLFLEADDANALGLRLEEIKQMEGVEDAYVCDETTLAIKIKEGGMVYYYYPPEPISIDLPEISDESSLKTMVTKTAVCENKSVLIINQLSNDYRFGHALDAEQTVKQAFQAQEFSVKVIHSEDFTAETLCEEMPKYGVTFLMTHGGYDNTVEGTKNTHFLVTGEKKKDLQGERLKKWEQAWFRNQSAPVPVKNLTASGEYIEVNYVAGNELYLDTMIEKDAFSKNSILFNVACRSLYDNKNLWNVLKKKKLGCYLGFDGRNSIGIDCGKLFFLNLLQEGGTVSDAYDALPFNKKHEFLGLISLECHPSDCQITLFGEPEVTDEEAVDLGLSVKWAKKNLGASNYTDKGNSYEDYDYMDIYYEDPILVGEDGEDVNLSGNEKYDYARKELGGSWRMPTFEDWQELKEKCTWKTATIDDKPGFLVTGPNGKNIFLPGKQYQQPVMGIQYYDGLYATGTLNQVGLRSFYIVGSMGPYGINTCQIEDMWIADTAFIRPVCD